MKHLSIKLRLSLLYTIAMTLVIAVVLTLLFSISSSEVLSNVRNDLERRVNESFRDISVLNNELIFDADFFEVQDSIYLSAYNEDSLTLLYGRIPYGFDYDLAFKEGQVRDIKVGEHNYYVYDSLVPVDGYGNLVIRGIISYDDAEQEFRTTLRIALILLPLLVVMTAVIGYLMSKRAMQPVARITNTVKEIREREDLSKRIALEGGSDEIYVLAKTFDELLDDIERSVDREKKFTSDAAHELRTPLAVEKMAIEDAMKKTKPNSKIYDDLKIIATKNEMMTKMVAQLLLLARADQGRVKIQKEVIDVAELLEALCLEFKELAKDKEITLEYAIDKDARLKVDETLFVRMINNVLENALKYSKRATTIRVVLKKEDDFIHLSIKDEGIGIKKDNLDKIFERFYQEDDSRSDNSAGLGLAIVKWIADVHDAKIKVSSKENEGTTFSFTFPNIKR